MSESPSPSDGSIGPAPFDPLEYLYFAILLIAERADETTYRVAISRLFYALFLIVREQLGMIEYQGIHRRVTAELTLRGHGNLASKLGQIRAMREIADYQLVPQDPNNRDWSNNWDYIRGIANRALTDMAALRWIAAGVQVP